MIVVHERRRPLAGPPLRSAAIRRLGDVDAIAAVERDQTTWMDGNTLAVTNFYLSDPSSGGYPCWRYSRVTHMLEEDATPSVGRKTALLEAAGHGGIRYSLACELVAGIVRVSYLHDFTQWASVDVAELCATGCDRRPLTDLFGPPDGASAG